MKPPVAILHAPGTNRDGEAAWACELAGGAPEVVLMTALLEGSLRLDDYRMLVLPGGFSYGDALGAGRLWSVSMGAALGAALTDFVDSGRPVLGICNGFQALVKAGILPNLGSKMESGASRQEVTLTHNASGRFECRWVTLEPDRQSPCVFTRGLEEPIYCPAAHAQGRLVIADPLIASAIDAGHLAPLRYRPTAVARDGHGSGDGFPGNPNGSVGHIAALTNPAGNVLGLMPHPEDHLLPTQHPRFHRRDRGDVGGLGLPLFAAGVAYAASL